MLQKILSSKVIKSVKKSLFNCHGELLISASISEMRVISFLYQTNIDESTSSILVFLIKTLQLRNYTFD